jgi:DNA-binding NarL/FixJ family response regulator
MKKQNINLLIVDDHQMIRYGIRLMLEKTESQFEFTIHEVENVAEAIIMVANSKFDIILMYYSLHNIVIGADSVIEMLSTKPQSKILAISNHREYIYLKNMIDAGVKGYVLKNILSKELIQAIEKIMSGKEYFSADVAMSFIKYREYKTIQPEQAIRLKKREQEILELIADEFTNDEIAEKLVLAKATISEYRQSLLCKFEAKNTAGLIRKATRLKLV